MGELIQFPTSRIVRRAPPLPKLTERQEEDQQVHKFIEELTEQLSMTILGICQENVVHMKGDNFTGIYRISIFQQSKWWRNNVGGSPWFCKSGQPSQFYNNRLGNDC